MPIPGGLQQRSGAEQLWVQESITAGARRRRLATRAMAGQNPRGSEQGAGRRALGRQLITG
eukprot:9870871-Alexandrium_andersonii.AAC.1